MFEKTREFMRRLASAMREQPGQDERAIDEDLHAAQAELFQEERDRHALERMGLDAGRERMRCLRIVREANLDERSPVEVSVNAVLSDVIVSIERGES